MKTKIFGIVCAFVFLLSTNVYAVSIIANGLLEIPTNVTTPPAVPNPSSPDPASLPLTFLNSPTLAGARGPSSEVTFGTPVVPSTEPSKLSFGQCNSTLCEPVTTMLKTDSAFDFGTLTYTNTRISIASTPDTQYLKALLDINGSFVDPKGPGTADDIPYTLEATYELFVGITLNSADPQDDFIKFAAFPSNQNLDPMAANFF